MNIRLYCHPVRFFALTTAIPWLFWFVAAYLSHMTPTNHLLEAAVSVLEIAGIIGPAVIAFRMIWPHPDLRNDVKRRIIGIRGARGIYFLLACLVMPASLVLAQAVSLLFGYSADQFNLSGMKSFSAGALPGWFTLLLAPFMEELAWHSYGNDSLRQRMNLLTTCLIFAVYWTMWHMPVSFIHGYYYEKLAAAGFLYFLNFMFSIIPYVIIVNWLYYKAHRSILVAILFHFTGNFFAEVFCTHPDTKLIQTILLLILALALVIKDRDFFFQREYREDLPGKRKGRFPGMDGG